MSNYTELKAAILRQKDELNYLLSRPRHYRMQFENASKVMDKSLIKVITGPRRAGKSTFALSLMEGKDFIYLNFDDQALSEVVLHSDLDTAIDELFGKETKNIFVDEIQNLVKFELWLNSLHRRGYNVVATGSNAHLLSRELGTHLTGRHVEIEILPFSYSEYGGRFETFYELGGFPDILLNGQDSRAYIEGLQSSIILKDIVQRYKVRQHDKILAAFSICASNAASLFSYKNIAQAVQVKSEGTVRKYLQYFEDTYMLFSLLPWTEKPKSFYRSAKKGYLVDTAFMRNISTSAHQSKKLENFVFVELIKSGLRPNQNLFYLKTKKGFEVDFIIKAGLEIDAAVQVCFDMTNIETRNREIRSLLDAYEETGVRKLIIVTWGHSEEIIERGIHIQCIPVKDFAISKDELIRRNEVRS